MARHRSGLLLDWRKKRPQEETEKVQSGTRLPHSKFGKVQSGTGLPHSKWDCHTFYAGANATLGKPMMTNRPEQFAKLVARLSQFDARQLDAAEQAMDRIEGSEGDNKKAKMAAKEGEIQSDAGPSHSKEVKDWPHAPLHRLEGKGAFIVTGGTHKKQHHFRDAEALSMLETELLKKARSYDWHLEAWAVFSNHYHFVGQAMVDAESLQPMLNHLHSDTARWVNQRHSQSDRQVWYNYWETKLTYNTSYRARLHYVHCNPVHHGLVSVANQYRWCSASWFEQTATPAQVTTIYGFKTDQIKIVDDFEPLGC